MKRMCYNCGKILKNSENSHLKKCSGLDYRIARYNQLIFDFSNFDLSKKNFEDLYNSGFSLIDFKKKFGLAYRQTNFLIDFYQIERISNDKKNKIKREKYEKTCLEKYDQPHHTTSEVINKIKKSCLEKYGVDNIFKNIDFIKKSISLKKEKYGKAGLGWINETEETKKIRIGELHNNLKLWWSDMDINEKNIRISIIKGARFKWWKSLSNEERFSFLENLKDNYHSEIEEKISKLLNDSNIKHKKQIWINRFSYDILIDKTILEINGDFWHCNPLKYNENYFHPYMKKRAKDIWEKDKNKKINAENYGYKVLYLWEEFIVNNSDETILNYITSNL
jgi:G:T-mismatch repair DNA endonuclease (very short patch repair protein)